MDTVAHPDIEADENHSEEQQKESPVNAPVELPVLLFDHADDAISDHAGNAPNSAAYVEAKPAEHELVSV